MRPQPRPYRHPDHKEHADRDGHRRERQALEVVGVRAEPALQYFRSTHQGPSSHRGVIVLVALGRRLGPLPDDRQVVASAESAEACGDEILDPPQVFLVGGFGAHR